MKKVYYRIYLIIILSILCLSSAKSIDSLSLQNKDEFSDRQNISGDWGGFRSRLEDQGVTLNLDYKGDVFSVGMGKVKGNFTYTDNFDIILEADMNKIIGWEGASFLIHGLGNHGKDPAESEGIKQGITNIAAPSTWKIFQFYLEQKLLNDRLSILLGMFDVNSHYDVKVKQSLFLNPSNGIGVDFAQSGVNGPSIFPTASLGIKIKASPLKNNYIQLAVLDGVSGDPNNPEGTHILLNKTDGLLICGELGFIKGDKETEISHEKDNTHQSYTKLAVGTWLYTQGIYHAMKKLDNWGFYLLLEQDIYQDLENPCRRVSVTGRFGIADDEVNDFDNFMGGSITCSSIFTTEGNDELGFAFSFAHNSYLHRLQRLENGIVSDDFEKIFEMTYKLQLTPYLAVQPDIQYIVSPGDLDYLSESMVFGGRLLLNF